MTVVARPVVGAKSQWVGGDMPFARAGMWVCGAVPMALLLWDAVHHDLGADPVNFAIHTTGFVGLLMLVSSLAVTPVRMVTGASWLIQFRRALGLYGFIYAAVHLGIYFWYQQGGSLGKTVHEIVHRYYLAIGASALLLMAPLAATSFNGAVRALGGRRWKRLHRLAYAAAVLGCVHYYMQVKADVQKPLVMGGALAVLLGYRVVRRRGAAPVRGVAAGEARYWKGEMRVAGMVRETESVRTFRLAPAGGGQVPFRFSAGQFLNLTVVIDGKRVGRSYTIASPPTRREWVELTIKKEDRGHVSRYLHEMLMEGHTVEVAGPAGRFTFDGKGDRVLLVAGGVGITPVMSILRDLTDRGWGGAIDLVFSVRTPGEIIFEGELGEIAARHANVRVHVTVTREGGEWAGTRGRITAEMVGRLVPDLVARPVYVCGPTAMAEAVRGELVAAGVPAGRIKVESFTPAAAVAADDGVRPEDEVGAVVTFERSGKTALMGTRKSVLEVAEAVGVEIDYDCRSGICGRCRTQLLSGEVSMGVQDALSEEDVAEGWILACQARAKGPIGVDA